MQRHLYELAGADINHRFSPYCLRIGYALAHLGLDHETVPVRFMEKEKIAFANSQTVPVLVDGEQVIPDSWEIACYLEETYGNGATLFGGAAARGATWMIDQWSLQTCTAGLFPLLALDIWNHVTEADKPYFRETREARLGMTLEEAAVGRETKIVALREDFMPLRATLSRQSFIAGDAPTYADYTVFSIFEWARLVSTLEILTDDDPITSWRAHMSDHIAALPAVQNSEG